MGAEHQRFSNWEGTGVGAGGHPRWRSAFPSFSTLSSFIFLAVFILLPAIFPLTTFTALIPLVTLIAILSFAVG